MKRMVSIERRAVGKQSRNTDQSFRPSLTSCCSGRGERWVVVCGPGFRTRAGFIPPNFPASAPAAFVPHSPERTFHKFPEYRKQADLLDHRQFTCQWDASWIVLFGTHQFVLLRESELSGKFDRRNVAENCEMNWRTASTLSSQPTRAPLSRAKLSQRNCSERLR